MEIKLSLSLPRDEISIPIVRRICTQALKVLGVSRECIDDVELALTEACANVLLHATADDEYEVSVGVDNQVAAIEVVDHGGGFDLPADAAAGAAGAAGAGTDAQPGTESDPTLTDAPLTDAVPEQGRGIFLMRAMMDQVQFHAVEGPHRGTRVHLEKLLTWDDSAPGARLGQDRMSRGPWSGQPRGPLDPVRTPDT